MFSSKTKITRLHLKMQRIMGQAKVYTRVVCFAKKQRTWVKQNKHVLKLLN